MTDLRVQPDRLDERAQAYGEIVRAVEDSRDELLACLSRCGDALGGRGAPAVAELRVSAAHGLGVLAHDHRQLQVGLQSVAACLRELDHRLFP